MSTDLVFSSLSSLNPGTVLLLVAVLGLTLWWIKPGKVKGRHPPGPAKWPIVGNLFSLKMGALDETLTEWRTRFGDIFEMYLGSRHVIVICGYENLREFLTKTGEAFLDRPNLAMAKASKFGSSGIILTNGHKWRETRRFSLIAMKDLGLGHQSLPDVVLAEARALCDRLLHRCNKAINLRPFFTNGVANVICSIVFGRGFEYDDPAFLEVTGALTRLVARGGGNSLVTIFPWLRYLPFFKGASNDRNAVERFIQSQVEEHRSSFDPKQTRDFIDFYLLVETGQSDFDKDIFNEAQMYSIIRDLFVAGTETTATTLLWAVVFMVLHPDVQERCREEILKIFGPDGAPNVSCRDQLPYVEATLLEIQRLGDIVPFGVLRTCAKDTAFKGFTIPKGTEVMTFLHSAHSDPKVWPEPSRFLPERWLSEDGKLVRHEQLITFSLGRRNCLGENVAKTELFLFFTLLLQQLRFTAPAGSPPLTTKGIAGGTRSPLPFEVVLTSVEAN